MRCGTFTLGIVTQEVQWKWSNAVVMTSCVNNTLFQTPLNHYMLWCHLMSQHWHQLDLIINNILNTYSYNSMDSDMDYSLLCATVRQLVCSKPKSYPSNNISLIYYSHKILNSKALSNTCEPTLTPLTKGTDCGYSTYLCPMILESLWDHHSASYATGKKDLPDTVASSYFCTLSGLIT